jgi:hypothetical protein
MLLVLIGALAFAWLTAIVVVLALCVNAAQADRAQARAPKRAPAPAHGGLRLIA